MNEVPGKRINAEISNAAQLIAAEMDRVSADVLQPTGSQSTPEKRIERWASILEKIEAAALPSSRWLQISAALDERMLDHIAAEIDNPDGPNDAERRRFWSNWIRDQLK